MRLIRENYLKMIRPYYEAVLIKVIKGPADLMDGITIPHTSQNRNRYTQKCIAESSRISYNESGMIQKTRRH